MELAQYTKQGRKRTSSDVVGVVYGKIPPNALDLENAVLGACLLEKQALETTLEILKPESFYADKNQLVFKAIHSLFVDRHPVDTLTVLNSLKTSGNLDIVGGPFYLITLTDSVVSTANTEAWCRIILQKFMAREMIRLGNEIASAAYDEGADVFDLQDQMQQKVSEFSLQTSRRNYKRINTVISKVIDNVKAVRRSGATITGVPTGIPMLDRVTHGWKPGRFIIIAARPSIGKSAVAGNLARNAALDVHKPTPVGIFSLEMEDNEWVTRLLSAESRVNAWDIDRGQLTDDDMAELESAGQGRLGKAPIFIDDTPGLNIFEFRSKARKMVLQDGVGLIILDYLQLMEGTGEKGQNREQEVSRISRNLKALAKELNVPIIALSQLNRAVETLNRKPRNSDLRESGAIEQDADMIMFLVPPDEKEVQNDPSLRDSVLISITKHRGGALDDVEVKFDKKIQKIMTREEWLLNHQQPGTWRKLEKEEEEPLEF